MAKRNSTSKPCSPTAWIDSLDPARIAAAFEEATMDSNDLEDQLSGLITMAQESLEFPFPAKVMGQDVQVVEAEWSERGADGLDLIVKAVSTGRHRIAAQSVELIPPLPDGAIYLAALLNWKQFS